MSEEDADPERAPRVGTVLEGRYRLTELLGSGGVGWVYRAEHLRLDTHVAVKMLKAPYAQHELLRPRFEREAKALAALRHPNIVSITDYSLAADGHPYLVMEQLEGRTLAELIAEGPVEEGRARRIVSQMLDALIYAHGRGFAHRDLKPGNVFLVELPTDPDHVKILDFGFVKLLGVDGGGAGRALTRSGIAFGTPSYMCPEQATGGETDPRSDLYSTTIVLFELLAGRRPFVGEIPEVIRAHLTEPVPPLSVGGHDRVAGPALAELLERGMAKEPADRFQTAEEMKAALIALPARSVVTAGDAPTAEVDLAAAPTGKQTALPETTPPPPTTLTPEAPSPPRASRPWMLAAVASLAVGGAAVAAWRLTPPDPPPAETHAGSPAAEADPEVEPTAVGVATDDVPDGVRDDDPTPVDEPAPVDDPAGGEGPTLVDDPALVEAALVEAALDDSPTLDDRAEGGSVDADFTSADPWLTRPADPALDAARRAVADGRPLPPPREAELRDWVRAHRDDPRGHLVLAQHYLARGHALTAVRRYALAYQFDPAAADDPRMLGDLARLAGAAGASTEAAALLAQAYPPEEARAAIDAALGAPDLDRRDRERLTAARATIDGAR